MDVQVRAYLMDDATVSVQFFLNKWMGWCGFKTSGISAGYFGKLGAGCSRSWVKKVELDNYPRLLREGMLTKLIRFEASKTFPARSPASRLASSVSFRPRKSKGGTINHTASVMRNTTQPLRCP